MYGTIAHLRVKPGMGEAFQAWAAQTSTAGRSIPGHIELIVYQMDSDPADVWIAVVFESREAYQANAASPEQHAEFTKMMGFLAAEPEWHDGVILHRA